MTTTIGKGKYTYRVIQDWAKLPSGETFGEVSAMATDSQDRLYVFQRKDPPVVIFDRDGKYLSSWGNSAFEYAHGIHIASDIVYLVDRDSSDAVITGVGESGSVCVAAVLDALTRERRT